MTLQDEFLNDSLQLLSDEPVRHMLYKMKESEKEAFSYDELVGVLVEGEHLEDDAEERFEVKLAHNYIPKMESHGIVEDEGESGDIRYIPHSQLESLLDCIKEEEDNIAYLLE